MQNESDADLQHDSETISTTSLDPTASHRSPVPSTSKDVHSPKPIYGLSAQGSIVPSTSEDVHSSELVQGPSITTSKIESVKRNLLFTPNNVALAF